MRMIVALAFLATAGLSFAQKEYPGLSSELGAAKQSYLRGKFEEALATLDRSDKSSGATMESRDLRGCIFMEQGKFDDAAKSFEAAHIANFNAFAPKIHRADLLLRQKKFEEAHTEFEKLANDTKAPMWPEYARFGALVCSLGEHDDAGAQQALATIVFPTETPAYYYAQAAWSFAHGKKSDALKWIDSAKRIFQADKTTWFDQWIYHSGWLKKKPAPAIDPFY
jgi:tetratricopeptide (TPR) repeat protein